METLIAWIVSIVSTWFNLGSSLPNPLPAATQNATYTVSEMVSGLEVPWDIVFTHPTRMLITERPGRIRQVVDGTLDAQPLFVFTDVYDQSEAGLMGMDLDPDYAENKYLYVCLTYKTGSVIKNKVVRLKDQTTSIAQDKVILDAIPGANVHIGCRVRFGPDQKLYVTTGDATDKSLAQDTNSKAGKILRMNSDGSDLEVFSLGHRNPQGIAWNSQGQMWETEHGPSGFDGPLGGDEINVIVEDGNYGWPEVSHQQTNANYLSPKVVFTPAIAPSGAAFLGDIFYVAALKGKAIYKITHDFNFEKLPDINMGRIRAITAGPDNALYFSTSNRDGRGDPATGDDKIFKITGLK